MSDIITLQGSDKLKNSRADLNTNFQRLNDDKAEKSGVRDSSYNYALATGSGNAFSITLSPAPTSYVTGAVINFKANHTVTGATTLNVNALGAKTIKKNKDYDLDAGDIKADGVYTIMYDGTDFQMISQLGKKYEAKDLKASAQSPPDLTLYVQAGSVNLAGSVVHFAGGNSPSFAVPTTNPRIDLLVLKSDATLEIIQGTEAVSPSAPSYPSNKFVICEVYNRATQSVIKESSDGSNGYIYKDVRPFCVTGIVGEIKIYGGASAPESWFLCQGQAISRTDYADLFDVIGTKYGAGDGSTTFNIPNLKGKVPVGLDAAIADFDDRGKSGGEKTHQLTIAELAAHTHSEVGNGTASGGDSGNLVRGTQQTGSTGGDTPHENMPPYVIVNYIIRY